MYFASCVYICYDYDMERYRVCLADRVNDYQHYALDAVESCKQYPDMGAQVR